MTKERRFRASILVSGLVLLATSFSTLSAGAEVDGCTDSGPVASGQVVLVEPMTLPRCGDVPAFVSEVVVRGRVDGIGLVGMRIDVFVCPDFMVFCDLTGATTTTPTLVASDECGPVLNSCEVFVSYRSPFAGGQAMVWDCGWSGVVALNVHLICEWETTF